MNRLPTIMLVSAVLAALGCGDGATEPPAPVEPPRATTIAVSPAQVRLTALDATVQFTVEVRDQNHQVMAGIAVTWSSSDAGVARVDAVGLVSATGNGNATITVTAGSVAGTAAVVVEQEAVTLQLTPEAMTFRALGDTLRLVAEAADANGHAVEVAWSSSNSAVATVDASGLVTAAGNGNATITVGGGGKTVSATVSVEQEAVAVIGLPAVDTLLWYGEPGDTLRLRAEAVDANRHPVEGLRVEWSSSLTWVATVDAGGLVRGAGEGVTTVTAAVGGLQASTKLAVVNRDRAALIALYHAAGGPNWERNRNWLTSFRMRDWEGVITNRREDGVVTVTDLRLPRNNLTGTIPPELGNLVNLKELYLGSNDLTGPIPPELGSLVNLKILFLYFNNLTGPIPPELGNLVNLEELHLSSNRLTGPIPPELGNLTKLTGLFLYFNNLTGPIPPWLGNLTSLRTQLNLGQNGFTGPIPPELGNLTSLGELNLPDNHLSGRVPPELGNLTSLRALRLQSNDFSGPIPPELASLARLTQLSLSDNILSGPIPSEFGNLTRLEELRLEENDLTGLIPPELGSLARLTQLNLSDNILSGPIPPELGNLTRLDELHLYTNNLTGPIPPELGSLARLTQLNLSDNILTGPIPSELGNLTRLEVLSVWDNNGLTGALPQTLIRVPLRAFYWDATQLCSPPNEAFQRWLRGIATHRGGSPCQ